MSETSKDKTKRKYIHYLTEYQWTHRYAIFYLDKSDSAGLIKHITSFKHELRRKYPSTPFLIRLLLLHRGELQAYLMINTTDSKLDIQSIADGTFPVSVKVVNQHLTAEKVATTAHAIRTQRPHDLNRFFGVTRVNRWSLLNRSSLIPIK